jgi:heme o synthase
MIPVSLWLSYLHVTKLPYTIIAILLGLWYLYATIRFARIVRSSNEPQNLASARNLLKVSVIYLPLLMLAMILSAQGRLLF